MQEHWEHIYSTKSLDEVSWTRPHLDSSLKIIDSLDLPPDASIIDVGSGASTLADDLVDRGFRNIAILDISASALSHSRKRLRDRDESITFIHDDIRTVRFELDSFDLWHDRAVFHFLTDQPDRSAYIDRLTTALKPGGHVIIATFASDGPPKCSGLDVCRYDAQTLQQAFGPGFEQIESIPEEHTTPFGTIQKFVYAHFRKVR